MILQRRREIVETVRQQGVVCVIEQASAQFVQAGDTIIVDAGTTVVKMAPILRTAPL